MTDTAEREDAAEKVVAVIRNRLALMSFSRVEAADLIRKYDFTAMELLDAAVRLTYRAS